MEGLAYIVAILGFIDNFARIFTAKELWERIVRLLIMIFIIIVFSVI